MKRINLIGFIGEDVTVKSVIADLENANGDDIELYLHSAGGLIYEALGIYQQIKNYKGKVIIKLGGLVASAMTYISTAGDEIIADPSTAYMIHNVWSIIMGDFMAMEKEAKELRRINKHVAERLSELSGKTVEEIFGMMNEETWLYGKEIIDLGLATKLENESTIENKIEGKENSIIFGKKEVEACMKRAASIVFNEKKDTVKSGPKKESKMATITKEEALEVLQAEMSSKEIAEACNVKIMSKDTQELLANLKAKEIDDPMAKIDELETKIKSDADILRSAKLTVAYGAESADNLERAYADKVTAAVAVSELDAEFEKLKTDPVMVNFAKNRADNNSRLNILDGNESQDEEGDIIEC